MIDAWWGAGRRPYAVRQRAVTKRRSYSHFVFAILQSGLTSGVATLIASLSATAADAFIATWLRSWLISWLVMAPIVIVAAPAIRRAALAVTREAG